MSFKITPNLWDKIRHFASFQQTGGMFFPHSGPAGGSRTDCMLLSLTATDGSVRAESEPRDPLACESVPARCVYCVSTLCFVGLTTPATFSSHRGTSSASGPPGKGTR